MILLLTRGDDGSTHTIIEWLIALKKEFVRLNADDERTKILYYDIGKKMLLIEHESRIVNLFDSTSVWHRRRGFSLKSVDIDPSVMDQPVFPDAGGLHKRHLEQEMTTLIEFIHTHLSPDKVIGNPETYSLNKFKVLAIAGKYGLIVPESYIITRKDQLVKLMEETGRMFITKALSNGVYKFTSKFGYYSYTEQLTVERLEKMPDQFFPSLVQVEIRKKYELRVFYLMGQFYAMAIFSQNDEATQTDFRKYNRKKPNRFVPYLLPEEIRRQLRCVLDELDLNTGSIDLIVDTDGRYIFLEVNPVGQFGMTSRPCNYYLEKKIAELL